MCAKGAGQTRFLRHFVLVALPLMFGCTLVRGLVGTEIVVAQRYETLEEQVLGSFGSLEDEVYALAGVRSVDPLTGNPEAPPPMTESKRRALEAQRSMEFNRDDVLDFKRRGYVGEGNEGLLVFFEDAKGSLRRSAPRLYELVEAVTAEENRDRLAIMQRAVQTTPALDGEEGLKTVKHVLAQKHRREAEPGTRVQLPDGRWVSKGQAT